MIGFADIAAATSANDRDSDNGLDHAQIVERLGVDYEGLSDAATERALKAIGVLFWGNPNYFPTLKSLVDTGDAGQLTTLSTLAGCFIDGFCAARRIPVET